MRLLTAFTCTIALLGSTATAAAYHPSAQPTPALQQGIARVLSRAGVSARTPGCAVLLAHGTTPVFARGYGLADLAQATPITEQTRFELASVSKQFTALAILRLVADRQLSLDATVGRLLPELRAPYPGASSTLRQLLQHTSGIPDYLEMLDDQGLEDGPWLDNQAVLQLLRRHPSIDFAPGTRYEYSNSGYALLATVIARTAHQSYGTFLRERVFAPLGMPDATVMETSGQHIEGRATPYHRRGRRFVIDDYEGPVVGDGGVVASLRDFARLPLAWRSNRILPQQLRDEAWTSARTTNGRSTSYGYGWSVERRNGERWISHDGSYVGFTSYVAFAPEQERMVAVLCNRDDLDTSAIGEQIYRVWESNP